ncbi:MAG: DUF4956 domain-containing protein [Eubacteriales bacterium]|nr:DUF4956 domain-containing protein [Eubacteriales bacterium]
MDTIKALFTTDANQVALAIITIVVGFIIGLFIYFIYKKTFSGVIYSRTFNLSLVMLTMVTAMVIMFVSNNVKMTLGMVGALSIVRFRTAIKDPIDTVFMFWAIAEGIALGAQFFIQGIIGAILIGLIMVILTMVKGSRSMPYLLIIHFDERAAKAVKQMVAQLPNAKLKSKTVQREGVEMAIELRVKESETGFVDKFLRVEGVFDATLIAHQGDMIS